MKCQNIQDHIQDSSNWFQIQVSILLIIYEGMFVVVKTMFYYFSFLLEQSSHQDSKNADLK